tara:strand:- start:1090 stop:1722 length:633 start_codon:yes stop_codon:yes gene_type:complete
MPTIANIAKINGIVISGAAAPTDRHILLGTQTASSSATLSFSGINSHRSDVLRSSFDVLEFRFTNIHPATDGTILQFQVNASGQTGFNEVMTTTQFETYHNEAGSDSALAYRAAQDQAQGTAYQAILTRDIGNDNDQSASGIMTLYNPSSTTYVKHFTAVGNGYYYQEYSLSFHTAGYINVTAAIDEISFNMNVGNIDAGVIKMYGIAKA